MPISEIEVGDTVLAYNEETGTTGEYTVTATMQHEDETIVTLTVNGEEIETTPWHLFYTDEGWVEAGDLQEGDLLLSLGGVYGEVEAILIEDRTETMYDLTVDEVHTFAVGDGDWVVHNQNGVFCPTSEAEQTIQNFEKTVYNSALDVEYVRVYNREGELLAQRRGDPDSVSLAGLEHILPNAIVTHNHPPLRIGSLFELDGGTFSLEDLTRLHDYNIGQLRAVTPSEGNMLLFTASRMGDSFNGIHKLLRPGLYNSTVRPNFTFASGAILEDIPALRAFYAERLTRFNSSMRTIGPLLGFQYDALIIQMGE